MTGDRELALTTLVVRAIERERARVSPSESVALERRIVGLRFGGSAAYELIDECRVERVLEI